MPRQRNIVVVTESYQKESKNFYQTLAALGYVENSCRYGQCCIEDFLHFIEQQGINDIAAITGIHLTEYQEYLLVQSNKTKGGTLNPKTIHHCFRNLNNFFTLQHKQGKIDVNPFDSFNYRYPNVPDKERTVLTQEEIGILYDYTQNAQEEAVLALAYGCGLRAGEIEKLNIEDIRYLCQDKGQQAASSSVGGKGIGTVGKIFTGTAAGSDRLKIIFTEF
jgi:integrase/recombinase XerD